MKTELATPHRDSAAGRAAEAIVRKCVHCGFCNATCPTYQLLGNELDGPRGRIYLIKQLLEGGAVSRATQQHLDRCLTCRNCETTCPSGVEYGRLVEIGRELVDQRVARPVRERAVRWMLREGLTSRWFGVAVRAGEALRPLLPAVLRNKLPLRVHAAPAPAHGDEPPAVPGRLRRRMLMLEGCVQPALAPGINAATKRVLAAAGIEAVTVRRSGCCGAIRQHLGDGPGALDHMRRNVDAWWPAIERGEIEAIVVNASGCSVAVKDYGHALRDDPAYASRAARITTLARDLTELLPDLAARLQGRLRVPPGARLAFHPPCTLLHGQQLRGIVEAQFTALGFDVRVAARDGHLCCGSAGTYSVLQPELAYRLRDRKLEALGMEAPDAIVSANIGCIQHLQSGTPVPVRHWVEVLADAVVSTY